MASSSPVCVPRTSNYAPAVSRARRRLNFDGVSSGSAPLPPLRTDRGEVRVLGRHFVPESTRGDVLIPLEEAVLVNGRYYLRQEVERRGGPDDTVFRLDL
jgi:hypothetical protein